MKILTEITAEQYEQVKNNTVPFEFDIIFDHGQHGALNIDSQQEISVSRICFLLDMFMVDDEQAKTIIKQTDEFLRLKGYKGKKLLAVSLNQYPDGGFYLVSKVYAIQLLE